MFSSFESLSNSSFWKAFCGVAFLCGLYKVVSFLVNLLVLGYELTSAPTNFSKYGAKSNKWAVVTGASDGIGKEYALQLAAKGFNVVLISRTMSKLEALAKEIEEKYKVSTKIIAFDASVDDPKHYEAIRKTVDGLSVTILINNVGQSHSVPVPFLETEEKELTHIITVNNLVTMKITQTVAPVIKETVKSTGKNMRGLILTMGSFGGLLPTPYLAVYSGSKAFLQQWSSALAGELKNDAIDVELVISYLVASAMSKIRRTNASIPSPKLFVAATLRSINKSCGLQNRYATSTPYWSHALMQFAIENTVGVYSSIANKLNLKMHKAIRTRALKKAARQKKE